MGARDQTIEEALEPAPEPSAVRTSERSLESSPEAHLSARAGAKQIRGTAQGLQHVTLERPSVSLQLNGAWIDIFQYSSETATFCFGQVLHTVSCHSGSSTAFHSIVWLDTFGSQSRTIYMILAPSLATHEGYSRAALHLQRNPAVDPRTCCRRRS